MNSDGQKEVYFDKFCSTCVNRDVDDLEMPCDECLGEPTNLYSNRPIKYESDETKSKGVSNESKEKTSKV